MKKIFQSNLFLLFIVLIILRLGLLALAASDMPNTQAQARGFDWWWQHGDQRAYFISGQKFLAWDFSWPYKSKRVLSGFPLLLAPLIKFYSAQQPADIAIAVVIIHSVFFYALAALLVYVLAKKILASVKQAALVLLLFLIYPYLFYYFFDFFASHNQIIESFKISRFKQLMFIHYGSDPLSMVLMLASLLLLLKIVANSNPKPLSAIGLGLTAGWAAITRLQNAIVGPLYAVVLLVKRRWQDLACFAASSLPIVFFQLYVNWRSNGAWLKTVYGLKKGPHLDIPFLSLKYPLRLIEYPWHYSPWLFLPMLAAAGLIILGIYQIIKNNKTTGLILTSYLLANTVFILFCEPTMRNPRYFLPVMPLFFIFSLLGLNFIYQKIYGAKV